MDGSANGQGDGGGHGIIRIRTNSIDPDAARHTVPTMWDELRRIRASAGLDVKETARRAGLSVVTVEAIEAGAIERLPIGEAGRREVVSLCDVLGVDPAPYLDDLREQLRPALASRFERQRPANRRSRLVVFGLIWAVLAVGFTVSWLVSRGPDTGVPATDAAATSNDVATSSTAAPSTTAPAPPAPADARAPGEAVTVSIVAARDDVWVRVAADGAEVQAGVVRHGDRVDVSGRSVDVVLSKPSATDVSVDSAPVQASATMHFGDAST